MQKILFLSHNAKDKALAEIISDILKRVSIQVVKTWFSSDDRLDGGFNAGANWYAEIHRKAETTDVLIALITPNSIDRPWLYYEAGLAKGFGKPVIPVCVGIKREDIRSPLNAIQAYQLTVKSQFEEFLGRVVKSIGLAFDNQSFKAPINKAFLKITSNKFEKSTSKNVDVEQMIVDIKSHFDQRLDSLPFVEKKHRIKTNDNSESYSIKFKLQFTDTQRDFITEIIDSDSFQTVTNNIFFNFSDIMRPYTYLEKWVIIDSKTKNYLVIREIASRVPAKAVFIKNRDYIIKQLTKPYSATDSKSRLT